MTKLTFTRLLLICALGSWTACIKGQPFVLTIANATPALAVATINVHVYAPELLQPSPTISLGGAALPATVGFTLAAATARVQIDAFDASSAIIGGAAGTITLSDRAATLMLQAGALPDSDGDGVADTIDDCPTVPDPKQDCRAAIDAGVVDASIAKNDLASSADMAPITNPDLAPSYAAVILAEPHLAAYYRFEDGNTPTVATDSAANAANGAYPAASGFTIVAGLIPGSSGAVLFSGGTGIKVPKTPKLEPTSITIEAWVQSTVASGNVLALVSYGTDAQHNPNASYEAYIFQIGHGAGTCAGGTFGCPETFVDTATGNNSFFTGAYTDMSTHYIVVTYDASTTTFSTVVDTVPISTSTGLSSQGSGGALTYLPSPDTNGLAIGNRYTGTTGGFVGIMDEVAIYSSVLTPTQISNHYHAAGH